MAYEDYVAQAASRLFNQKQHRELEWANILGQLALGFEHGRQVRLNNDMQQQELDLRRQQILGNQEIARQEAERRKANDQKAAEEDAIKKKIQNGVTLTEAHKIFKEQGTLTPGLPDVGPLGGVPLPPSGPAPQNPDYTPVPNYMGGIDTGTVAGRLGVDPNMPGLEDQRAVTPAEEAAMAQAAATATRKAEPKTIIQGNNGYISIDQNTGEQTFVPYPAGYEKRPDPAPAIPRFSTQQGTGADGKPAWFKVNNLTGEMEEIKPKGGGTPTPKPAPADTAAMKEYQGKVAKEAERLATDSAYANWAAEDIYRLASQNIGREYGATGRMPPDFPMPAQKPYATPKTVGSSPAKPAGHGPVVATGRKPDGRKVVKYADGYAEIIG